MGVYAERSRTLNGWPSASELEACVASLPSEHGPELKAEAVIFTSDNLHAVCSSLGDFMIFGN